MDRLPVELIESSAFRYAIGLDRGGTNVRVGLVRSDGKVLKLIRERTAPLGAGSWEARERQFVIMLSQMLSLPEVCGDGIVAGTCGAREMPWQDVAVRQALQQGLHTDLPIRVEIDTKAAAWGEYLFGAGAGCTHVVYLAVGTGIGGGLILDGKLYHGASGFSALAGHVTVNMDGPRAASGMMGPIEDYASGTAIAVSARSALYKGRFSRLRELSAGDVGAVTSEMVFEAARAGDALANEVVGRAAYALGITVAGLIHLFNPDVVILGGGVVDQGDFVLEPVRRTVAEHAIRFVAGTPIVPAKLGNMAGVVGAAGLFWP
jgi:glucokinase